MGGSQAGIISGEIWDLGKFNRISAPLKIPAEELRQTMRPLDPALHPAAIVNVGRRDLNITLILNSDQNL